MRIERRRWARAWRRLAPWAVAGVGIVALVGSGGGDAPPGCSVFAGTCDSDEGPLPPVPYAEVVPDRLTVQAGLPVTFRVASTNVDQPTFRWCRLASGAADCTELPGATASSYTVAAAELADDGAQYRVTVNGTIGSASASGRLAVSSRPPIVIEDGNFASIDWWVRSGAAPVTDGPTVSETRYASGGNPDAYLRIGYEIPTSPASAWIYHTYLALPYDPAQLGEIHVIDFTLDCLAVSLAAGTTSLVAYTQPVLTQGDRLYAARADWTAPCRALDWLGARDGQASLASGDFVLVSGPVCGPTEACPDFSAGALPLRFGFVAGVDVPSGVAAAPVVHAVDNWQVRVWRP
jgi:hypothetical protein